MPPTWQSLKHWVWFKNLICNLKKGVITALFRQPPDGLLFPLLEQSPTGTNQAGSLSLINLDGLDP